MRRQADVGLAVWVAPEHHRISCGELLRCSAGGMLMPPESDGDTDRLRFNCWTSQASSLGFCFYLICLSPLIRWLSFA